MNEKGIPLVVEICGLPSSGKTTLVNNLFEFFKKSGYSCKIIPESSSEIKRSGIPKEEELTLNYFLITVLRTAEELLLANGKKDFDYIFVDRGLVDRLIWNEWMASKELIDHNSYTILKSFIEYVYSKRVNWKTLILLVSFQEAMRRHNQRTGPIMNNLYFSSMEQIYRNVRRDLISSNTYVIETTRISKKGVLESALTYLK